MILLILTIVLNFTFASETPPAHPVALQQPRATVVPYPASDMPVIINTAVAENRSTDSWLTYSITNKSRERIEKLELQVFIVDGMGKLVSIEEASSREGINPGATQAERARIPRPIMHNGLSIIAVTKAVGDSGVWKVDLSELKRAVASRISGHGEKGVTVAFEPHAKVSATDRVEIFKLLLNDLLNDDVKAERLKDRTNVLVLSEDVEFDLPQIQNVNISKFDKDDIQRIADEKGRIFYLIYRSFVVEGSRVMARLSIRDQLARRPGIHVPYKFTYLFTCVKRDGRWTIEKSLGYAES